jgi:hypothetical protein
MESLPHLELMPRVGRDIARCLYFVFSGVRETDAPEYA